MGVFKKFVAVGGPALALRDGSDDDFSPITEFAAREEENLAAIWEATERRRELRILYRKPRSTANERRTIHPLHVDCPGRRWIVVARDAERSGYRTFRLGRVRPLRPTGGKFKVPPDFDAAKLLCGNVGAYTGREDHEVRIVARDSAATFADEEGLHCSQKFVHCPDDRLEVTIRVNNLIEIKYDLLCWGPEVEVLSPPPLRDALPAREQYGQP